MYLFPGFSTHPAEAWIWHSVITQSEMTLFCNGFLLRFVRSKPFSIWHRKAAAGTWDFTAICVMGRHSVAQEMLILQLKDMSVVL